ncbi:MAG: PIN domain-containing protein [Deltaproteobacteria bacterium]|nr:PIN domain-containing protein [Deltaproteobacteria bacterium]
MLVFDTDVVSFALRRSPPPALLRRIAAVDPSEQAITSITAGELVYGAHRSDRAEVLLKRLDELVWPNLRVLAFDRAAAVRYGRLRAELERAGRPVSEPDLRIAAVCLSVGATFATGNVRHFAHIPGLRVENWLADCR